MSTEMETAVHNVRSIDREIAAIEQQIKELTEQLDGLREDASAAADYLAECAA
jgi:septation ring formation regulator EzrA